MKRVFIVSPNIGLHMGKGGGVRVCMAITKVFEDLGYEPYFVAVRGYAIEKLNRLHSVELKKTRTLYMFGYGPPLSAPFPMQVMLITRYLGKLIYDYNPEIIVFNDDIPKINETLFKNRTIILYSHFPYAARIRFNVTDAFEIEPPRRQIYKEILYRKYLAKLIYMDYLPESAIPIANSSITAAFMSKLWNIRPKIIFPPLIMPKYAAEMLNSLQTILNIKRNIATIVATIQPNKRIGDVIRTISKISINIKLMIIGHTGSDVYLRYLLDLVTRLNIKDKIKIYTDVPEWIKWDILMKSKAIISAAHFEPFGINVLEGMSVGAVPIVYKESLSGPWIDIVERGKYGFGFKDEEELASILGDLMSNYNKWRKWTEIACMRSKYFNYDYFKEKLT